MAIAGLGAVGLASRGGDRSTPIGAEDPHVIRQEVGERGVPSFCRTRDSWASLDLEFSGEQGTSGDHQSTLYLACSSHLQRPGGPSGSPAAPQCCP